MPDVNALDWHRRYQGRTALGRFMSKIDYRQGDCWIWVAGHSDTGYGSFAVQGVHYNAHRFLFELWYGPVPAGLQLDHLCRNRSCVNPEHLEPVSQSENILRGTGASARNAAMTHCKRGHEFTADNLYVRPDGRGINCATCIRLRKDERLARQRAERRARGLKRPWTCRNP